jgi:DNA-binding transcriptional LysR family regulator
MDLWQLNIFCKVIELKSFSKAGKAVHLSQPTVSSHIKDLEDHFGCRLIDRLSKEAIPTKAGEILYDYARKLTNLKDEAESALSEFQGRIKGRLVIGGSTIPGNYILPQIIGAFFNNFQEVTISLILGDTAKIINDTLSGVLELSIVGAKTDEKRIVQERLLNDKLYLIVSKEHNWSHKDRISIERLLQEPFVIRKHGSGTLKTIQKGLSEKGYSLDDLNIVAEMGSTEAVCQGIKSNIGVSVLSTRAIAEELQTGALMALSLKGLDLNQSFYLTTHKYRSISPLGKKFIEFLKEELPKLA